MKKTLNWRLEERRKEMFEFEENAIKEFKGEHRFLSNFWKQEQSVAFLIGSEEVELTFPTNEHFYQASKASTFDGLIYVKEAETPGQAKRRGRSVSHRKDWEEVKEAIMLAGLRVKFRNPSLRRRLVATWPRQLVEGNWWNDKFWGVCLKTNEGENKLGELLMKVREEVMDENVETLFHD
jgi:hypothetical protein